LGGKITAWVAESAEDIHDMSRALTELGSNGNVKVDAWDAARGEYAKNRYKA
jgi:hypothetical protein